MLKRYIYLCKVNSISKVIKFYEFAEQQKRNIDDTL